MHKAVTALILSSTLTLMACAGGPSLSPADTTPPIPGHLLVHPQDPPKVQRTTDPATGKASMTGGDATQSMTGLYDYIGAIKGQLDSLIDAVLARDSKPVPKKRGFHL